ncbi:hypothetical protein ACIBHX_48100 [Nonomuraea sp. NPDC050536]|uniref:hypothetical protein n=1 Tax=Nonomuraea sp. NPDC050536 TaxID=3364366 RepID=UPI0037C7F3D6
MWIALVISGLMAGALGVVFIVLDLAQADQLASVIGVFVGLAGLGVSVYGLVLARRGAAPDSASSPVSATPQTEAAITARGERSVATRENSGVILTGGAERISVTGAGETHNTIDGGIFHGPVIQGRDITGLPAADPSPRSSSPSVGGPDTEEPSR